MSIHNVAGARVANINNTQEILKNWATADINGLSCIIHSICRILTFHESIISHQSEASLRVLFWFTLASELLCSLFITVLLEKLQVARRIQMLYECIALSASLIVSHPVLYMYNSVRFFDGMPFLYQPTVWISVEKIHAPASTQRSHSWDEIILPRAKDKIQQEETRRITLRIAFLQLGAKEFPWTYGLAIVMPSTQGLLCLALLVVTPAFDEPRARFAAYTRRRIGKNELVSEMRLDFAKLNLSTINLSPYHSRDSSIYVATKQFER
ncbi:hypothetical protein BX661DRAFT_184509 [Kickxella alabastrina]|uniref:uncharacterized protein n=1 Tax=Kickxella alabastrina TaxID=61397 RepID=UPI00221EB0EA|nr:uncharacterized protein BX661DRAFT_184509 [Kickxella alabastrina]KAI7825424.1 hypothetical protein BX661DRAFT_184509 [Kickxella alabastrina]